MKFIGLTEICGEPGIGKTKLSLHFSLNNKTMYISSKNIKLNKICHNEFYLLEIFYLKDLLFLFKHKIEQFIINKEIILIIIDSLEHLVISEEINKFLYFKIKELFFIFKTIIYKHKIKIIVINNLFENKLVGWMYRIFGIRYLYSLNTRIVLFKINNLSFVKKTHSLDENECKRFITTENGIEILN